MFLLALGAVCSAAAFALPVPASPKRGLSLGLELGTGVERETGIAWGIGTRLGVVAGCGRTFLGLGLSCLAGRISPESEAPGLSIRAPDSATCEVGCLLLERPRLNLVPRAFWRWRSYGEAGSESSYGLILDLEAGRGRSGRGPALIASCGYSVLWSRYRDSEMRSRDIYPLLRLGWRYRAGPRLAFDLAISDFSESDSATFLKTFLEFRTRFALRAASLDLRLCAKYSDFFTLTSYVDGFSAGLSIGWALGSPRRGG